VGPSRLSAAIVSRRISFTYNNADSQRRARTLSFSYEKTRQLNFSYWSTHIDNSVMHQFLYPMPGAQRRLKSWGRPSFGCTVLTRQVVGPNTGALATLRHYCYDKTLTSQRRCSVTYWTFPSRRTHYQNCSVLYCVLKLYTVISTLRWTVLTVLWIGFCHTGSVSLCIDLFVFICVYFMCFYFILHSCYIIVSTVVWTWCDWSLIPWTCLSSVLWHCWLGYLTRKTCPRYDL